MAEGNVEFSFSLDISQFEKSISGATKLVDDFKKNWSRAFDPEATKLKGMVEPVDAINAGLKGIKRTIGSIIALKIGDKIQKSVQQSIAFTERINLFNVAMGSSRKEMNKWMNTLSEAFGLDPSNLYKTTGMFRQISLSMGLAAEQADMVSRNFTKAAIDLASLKELNVDDAIEKLEAGLVGLPKALRDIGIVVDKSALQLTAYSIGIQDSVSSMSEASKVGLRYITILRGMEAAMGDFAKTIESPANQIRVLHEQVQRLSRAIGNLFVGALATVLPYLNGFIMALRTLIELLGKFLGLTGIEMENSFTGLEDSAWGVGDAISDATKKAKMLVAPFDELNILNEDAGAAAGGAGGFGGMDPRILEAMKEYDNLMDKVQMKANKIRDYIMETLGFTKHINEETGEIEWVWSFDGLLKGLQRAVKDLFDWWNSLNLGQKLAAIFVAGWAAYIVGTGIKLLLSPFTAFVGGVLSLFANIITRITHTKTVWEALGVVISRIGLIIKNLGGLVGQVFSAILSNAGVFGTKFLSILTTIGTAILNVFLHPLTTVKNIITVVGTLFSTLFTGLMTSLSTLWTTITTIFTGIASFIGISTGWVVLIVAAIAAVIAAIVFLWKKCEWFRKGVTKGFALLKKQVTLIVQHIAQMGSTVWDIIKQLLQLVVKMFSAAWTAIQAIFKAIASFLKAFLAGPVGQFLTGIAMGFGAALLQVINLISGFLDFLDGMLMFLNGDFSGGIAKMLSGLSKMFSSAFNMVKNIVIGVINGVIGAVESGINACIDAINALIRAYNRVASKLGLSTISELSHVAFSRLELTIEEFDTEVENPNAPGKSWQDQAAWDDENIGTGTGTNAGKSIWDRLGLSNLFGKENGGLDLDFDLDDVNFDMDIPELNFDDLGTDLNFDFNPEDLNLDLDLDTPDIDMGDIASNLPIDNIPDTTTPNNSNNNNNPQNFQGLQPGDKIIVQVGGNEWDAEVLKSVRRAEAQAGYTTISGGTFNG